MRIARFATVSLAFTLSLFVAGCGGGNGVTSRATDYPDRGGGNFRFEAMTRNVYYGADLAPAVAAMLSGDVDGSLKAVHDVHAQVIATDFAARATGLVDEIADRHLWYGPEVIALQEVALWRRQVPADSFGDAPTPATTVFIDQLAILLSTFEARGLHYRVAAVQEGFDAELPYIDDADGPADLRITDRDVLLVREDIAFDNASSGNYVARVVLDVGLELPCSWVACDLTTSSGPVRVIGTHLEADAADIRVAQTAELLAGPADVAYPVVLLGDMNATPPGTDLDPTIVDLRAAGFIDAWATLNPDAPGYTFGLDADLLDPSAVATERLDYVLVRGAESADDRRTLAAIAIAVVGLDPAQRVVTADGRHLWHSDHGGVCAMLSIN